jgi:hypothetical protein
LLEAGAVGELSQLLNSKSDMLRSSKELVLAFSNLWHTSVDESGFYSPKMQNIMKILYQFLLRENDEVLQHAMRMDDSPPPWHCSNISQLVSMVFVCWSYSYAD